MGTAEAIFVGVIAGFIGFLPLFFAIRLSQRTKSTKVGSAAAIALLGTLISLIIVVVELALCSKFVHEAVMPFGLSELAALIVSTSIYVVYKNVLAKRRQR